MQSDQSKLNINTIYFFERENSYPNFISNYIIQNSNTNFIKPSLLIRSYQLERIPLHIIPYLYQQVLEVFERKDTKTTLNASRSF